MTASAPGQLRACRAARIFGTMPPLITPSAISRSASSAVMVGQLLAGGVSHAVDVGHQHELAGAHTGGDSGRRVVGVDVADDALLVAGERRHHGHLAGHQQRIEEVAADPHHVGHETQAGHSLGDHEAAVHAAQTHGVDAAVAQVGHELGVDHSPENGRGHVQGRLVGHAQSALEPARYAEPLEPLGDALAAAVDEHHGPRAGDRRDLVEDVRLVGERGPAELEDEDFAHVVYSAFSMTYPSVRSQPNASPMPPPRPR